MSRCGRALRVGNDVRVRSESWMGGDAFEGHTVDAGLGKEVEDIREGHDLSSSESRGHRMSLRSET